MEALEEIVSDFMEQYWPLVFLIGGGLFSAFKIVVVPWAEAKKEENNRKKNKPPTS